MEESIARKIFEDRSAWALMEDDQQRPILPKWFRIRCLGLNGINLLALEARETVSRIADSFGKVPNKSPYETEEFWVVKQYYQLVSDGIIAVSKSMAIELIKEGEKHDN